MKVPVAFLFILFLCQNCKNSRNTEHPQKSKVSAIIDEILYNKQSFYYTDFSKVRHKNLPVGVFDSGTGGLTVLEAILNFDEYDLKGKPNPDGVKDFSKESFIYFGDQANMPYGNYAKENKTDLLQEHIVKDVQFLLGDKFYESRTSDHFRSSKTTVKAIVIACNTATAYGKKYVEDFIKKTASNIKVIGVIDAGVRGALQHFSKGESGVIGVLATEGTVKSKGYKNTIYRLKKKLGFTGDIKVVEQGGLGIAEAIDEDANYLDRDAKEVREYYKGPTLDNETHKILKELLPAYNFNFKENRMLCDNTELSTCNILQINDPENYVRYHLVTMLEKLRLSNTDQKLKSLILGCTHYPYMKIEIAKILQELYNYQREGAYVYRPYLVEDVILIDPALNTARELYAYFKDKKFFSQENRWLNSSLYISVPNIHNPSTVLRDSISFTYDYKYGRKAGDIQEYVKVIPFKSADISPTILKRLSIYTPNVYQVYQSTLDKNEKQGEEVEM